MLLCSVLTKELPWCLTMKTWGCLIERTGVGVGNALYVSWTSLPCEEIIQLIRGNSVKWRVFN